MSTSGVATDRRAERQQAVAAALASQGLDGLLVTHLPNIRYLTGFTGSAGMVLVTGEGAVLLTDFRYEAQAGAEVGELARVEVEPQSLWDRLWAVLESSDLERIGFEAESVSVRDAERFAAGGKPWRWTPTRAVVEGLRLRKGPDEVAAIARAAALALGALEATLGGVEPGLRELEIATRLEAELRRRGSEWHPFPTIVASGPRSALPHARASERVVARGELLLLDFGAQLDGYCADITRTVVLGRADARQRACYAVVEQAQRTAREGLRAGMTGREADALAREVIERAGLGSAFGHSLGHGVGLEVHEAPRLSRTATDPLPADAVVTVEPGVYLAGWGGIRLEDDVHLSAEGPVLLSDGRTELREV